MSKSIHAQIPENLHGEELKDWLETNASTTKEDEYTRYLTPEELIEKNAEYVKTGMQHDVISEEFADVRKGYTSRLKTCKTEIKNLSKIIRRKAVQEFGPIFIFRDDDKGRIIEYTATGQLIVDRRMTPEDRQTIIKFSEASKKAQ